MIIFIFDTKEDRDKFSIIYDTYRNLIYYTIRRFVSDEYIIEDLSQEIYISLFTNLPKIDIKEAKKTRNYIITIARNRCKNFLRDQDKIKEDVEEELEDCKSNPEDILDHILSMEHIHQVTKGIRELDDIYKSILELKYINDFSNDEIAKFLGIKKKTVEMRLYRARKILQERMKDS